MENWENKQNYHIYAKCNSCGERKEADWMLEGLKGMYCSEFCRSEVEPFAICPSCKQWDMSVCENNDNEPCLSCREICRCGNENCEYGPSTGVASILPEIVAPEGSLKAKTGISLSPEEQFLEDLNKELMSIYEEEFLEALKELEKVSKKTLEDLKELNKLLK